MNIINSIEEKLESVQKVTVIPIITICLLGIMLRVLFISWDQPSEAPDTFTYLIRALSFARGDFSSIGSDFVFMWPLFLSIFFAPFHFNDFLGYMNIMRVVSIFVSACTVPVIYLISKRFVKKRYALLVAAFFTLEANLVENSVFAITEPLFILLGLISFYFLARKNEKLALLAFFFAGLSFDVRQNGIVLMILAIFACSLWIRPKKKMIIVCVIGIGIFLAAAPQYVFIPVSHGEIPFVWRVSSVGETSQTNKVIPHLIDPTSSLLGKPSETIEIEPVTTKTEVYKAAFLKEFLHLFRISVPYLAIFVPFGLLLTIRDLRFENKILLAAIGISLVIAFPQYTLSSVYRNLYFIIPFFCILSAIAVQRLTSNIELKNIFLVLLILGILLLSFSFLRNQMMEDSEMIMEKEQFGKYIASNYHGVIVGDNYNYILHNIPDLTQVHLTPNSNEKMTLLYSWYALTTYDDLVQYVKTTNVDYLIIDDEYDNRYPIFQDIFYHVEKYPELEKVFDSDKEGYQKYRVKIFKVLVDRT